MSALRIAIVDDHRVVARSLQSYLESFPDMHVVGIASSGEELLAHLAEWNPEIVIQDLLLPGGIDGIETTPRANARPRTGHRAHRLHGRGAHGRRPQRRRRRVRTQGRRP